MATINDVAREAGVSIATVSYVLNKSKRVNPETANKVYLAIKKLKYRPSRIAQSLVKKSTGIISVLISDITDPFFAPIVRGIEDVANESGYVVMIGNSDEDCSKTKNYFDVLGRHRIDGLIISPTEGIERMGILNDLDIPTVFVNRKANKDHADVVETDNPLGSILAIEHLTSLGHSRIGFVSGPNSVSTYAGRLQGYETGLAEAGLPVDRGLIRIGGFHPDSGYRLTMELLNLDPKPTALYIASGRLTHGAYQAIKEYGISVPEQLSLVCFDDTEWSTLVAPPLTTIFQKTYELGQISARLLLERLAKQERDNARWDWDESEGPEPDPLSQNIKIPPRLIVRNSTGPAPL